MASKPGSVTVAFAHRFDFGRHAVKVTSAAVRDDVCNAPIAQFGQIVPT